jgi:hypothetical protein
MSCCYAIQMKQAGFALVLPQALTDAQAVNTMEPAAALLAIAIKAASPVHALKMVAVMAQIRAPVVRLKACYSFGSSACVAARHLRGNDQPHAAECLRRFRLAQIEPLCRQQLDAFFLFQYVALWSALHHW